MPKGMHNPLPASPKSECKKASQIVDSFINGSWRGSPGKELPPRVLANAKGLAILTVTKAGLLGTIRFGSGILVARLADGTWSHPSAIGLAGVGAGGQAGFELTDFVFILNDESALRALCSAGSLTLSGNLSIAFGPLGRNAEIGGAASHRGTAAMYSYAKTKGLFGGVSLEGGMLVERKWANRRFYGRGVSVGEILGGEVRATEDGEEDVRVLMGVLERVFAVEGESGTESAEGTRGTQQESAEGHPVESQNEAQGPSETAEDQARAPASPTQSQTLPEETQVSSSSHPEAETR